MKKSIQVIVGTRPEAVKLCPLILELKKHPESVSVQVCSTGQHKEILKETFSSFGIVPDTHLDIMRPNASLSELTSRCLTEMNGLLTQEKPSLVLVQGDTTTAFASGLASFYHKIPVGHIEAGLRTYNPYLPFPEEMNRKLLSSLSTYHFAPTELSKKNLLNEGYASSSIWVTGNTVIDAVKLTLKKLQETFSEKEILEKLATLGIQLSTEKKRILVTCHRRENMETSTLSDIAEALNALSKNNQIIVTKHPNPNMLPLYSSLKKRTNILLIYPPEHPLFLWLLSQTDLVISDSGGVQEESSSFGKPVLILRDSTERPEIVDCGLGILVGSNTQTIIKRAEEKLSTQTLETTQFPFGDGTASKKITQIILEKLA